MKISLNWIKDFIDLPTGITSQQVAEDLTLATVEIEAVIDQKVQYANMVVGAIKEIKEHPNADKLNVCIVDIGNTEKQIICGGKNIYEGMKCAVALPGAKVRWHGEGDLVELEEAEIRGEKSFGMICAEAEIGLDQKEMDFSVMDLKDIDASPGTPLANALGLDDVIFDVDNKSLTHRPDLWGMYGIARELAAIYKSELRPLTQFDESKLPRTDDCQLDIHIENTALCPRFVGCVIDGIHIGPSPEWLQRRLRAVGQRPINAIVDITNYVMFEVGEPTHVYDMSKVKSQKSKVLINVRNASDGEKIVTLDGSERELTSDTLVIADEEQAIAIAGVMGGANTEVDESTTRIIFEAANFNAQSVRKTTQQLNHRTEGSTRWEKALDPNLAKLGMLRALALISEIIPDAQIGQVFDEDHHSKDPLHVHVRQAFLDQRIGTEMDVSEVSGILGRLGFRVEHQDGEYTITVPSWRATGDVSIAEDIVEELARIYGYNALAFRPPRFVMERAVYQRSFVLERRIREFLSFSAGMHEVYHYPWADQRIFNVLQSIGEEHASIEILNPPAEEHRYVVRSLIPNMLKSIEENLRYVDSFKLFELARVFFSDTSYSYTEGEDLPHQPKHLAGTVVRTLSNCEDVFYETKGLVTSFLSYFRIPYSLVLRDEHAWLDTGFEFGVLSGDVVLGEFGLLNQEVVSSLKIEAVVGLMYFDVEAFIRLARSHDSFQRLPVYPPVTRDIAIIVEQTVRFVDVEAHIRSHSDLLDHAEFFDVYEGEQVGEGMRSLAWHLYFRHPERTLTSQEADEELARIVSLLEEKFGARLRA